MWCFKAIPNRLNKDEKMNSHRVKQRRQNMTVFVEKTQNAQILGAFKYTANL